MNAYRAYWNERQINDKRLFVGALAAINSVISSALSGKLPSESAVLDSFKTNLVPRMIQTFKNGAINALQSTEKIWGDTLPPLKQITKSAWSETIAKGISVSDLTSLGIPNDQTIIRTQCIDKVKTISSTFHGRLKKEFVESVANGEDQRQLINRIKSVQAQATNRARRIAQTEATRLYNGGSLMGYEKSTVVSGRKWTINTFGNVRPAHRSASGQIVAMGKPFIVMGEKLMFPGDPSGSPENTINCHCGVIPVIGRKPKTIPKPIEVKPVVPKVPEIKPIDELWRTYRNTDDSQLSEFARRIHSKELTRETTERSEVILAVKEYTDGNYKRMRKDYKKAEEKIKQGIIDFTEKEKQSLLLNDIIDKQILADDTTLYRGLSWDGIHKNQFNKFVETMKPGTEFDFEAMSSFSTDAKVAKKFANKGIYQVQIEFKDGGFKGLDVSSLSNYDEKEVIMGAGQKVKVTKVTTSEGVGQFGAKTKKVKLILESVKTVKSINKKSNVIENTIFNSIFDYPLSDRTETRIV